MAITVASLDAALRERLQASFVSVQDTSGGCGSAFDVMVVSDRFEGLKLLERHKAINAALSEEMRQIHALSIKKAITPAQYADLLAKAQAGDAGAAPMVA